MPPISLKRIFFAIVIIILLSKLDRVIAFVSGIYRISIAFISGIYWMFYFSFEPLRKCSVEAKYVVALLFLALIYITVYKILQKKRGEK